MGKLSLRREIEKAGYITLVCYVAAWVRERVPPPLTPCHLQQVGKYDLTPHQLQPSREWALCLIGAAQ